MPLSLKHLLAALPTLALLPAAAQSASSTTIYGRLTAAMEHASNDGSRLTRLSNYRSVLGFRGAEDLGGGLQAVWQLEGALSLDTGAGPSFTNRDSRVGLSGPWGTAFMGVWALPYTLSTSAFDPFYPTTAGYMSIMGNGSASITDHVANTSAFDRRQTSQVQYWSPSLGGFTARVAYGPNEGTVTASGGRPWLASGDITYQQGDLLVTLAAEHHNAYQTRGTSDSAAKLGLAYQWGPARLSAVVEKLRYGTASGQLSRTAWYTSATYRIGAGMLKAAYGRAGDGRGPSSDLVGSVRAGAGTGASQYTLGYDHALSKRTTLLAFFSRIDNRRAAAYDFAINDVGASAGSGINLVALGLRHTF